MPRYLFKAARATLLFGPASTALEIWFGLESEDPIDIAEYSRDTGYDLINCEGMTTEEIDSCQVREWIRV